MSTFNSLILETLKIVKYELGRAIIESLVCYTNR